MRRRRLILDVHLLYLLHHSGKDLGRPETSWLSVVSKDMEQSYSMDPPTSGAILDMKGVGTPDAMVMAEDRLRWKRVVGLLLHMQRPRRACFLSEGVIYLTEH